MEERSRLAWQWASYERAHRDRKNLILHALTNPMFLAGGLSLVAAIVNPWIALGSSPSNGSRSRGSS